MNPEQGWVFLQLCLSSAFPRTSWQWYFETMVTELPKLGFDWEVEGHPHQDMEVFTHGPTPRPLITAAEWFLLWMVTKGVGEITFQSPGTLTSQLAFSWRWLYRALHPQAVLGSAWLTIVEIPPPLWMSFWYPCAHLPATNSFHRWFHKFRRDVHGVFTKIHQGGIRLCICITKVCLCQHTIYPWCQIFGKRLLRRVRNCAQTM